MFILFTPYTFIFFIVYLLFTLSLFIINNFYFYWAVIELLILIFMGIRYTLFFRTYSQLIVYFLIQVVSSFSILIFYVYSIPLFLTISFLIKLAIFPFFFWYITLIYRFPNFVFWLSTTLHKIPPLLMMKIFSLPLTFDVLWFSILLTTFVSGLVIVSLVDLRIVLVLSSVGNNSWLVLSQFSRFSIFLSFIFFYSLGLLYLVSLWGSSRKILFSFDLVSVSNPLTFWVLFISGLPPFPIFYLKMLIVFSYLNLIGINYLFLVFLFLNSFMVIGYVQSVLKYFLYVYSSHVNYFIKY